MWTLATEDVQRTKTKSVHNPSPKAVIMGLPLSLAMSWKQPKTLTRSLRIDDIQNLRQS